MIKFAVVAVALGVVVASAQTGTDTPTTPVPQGANPNTATSLAGKFFAGDFFNATGYFNGVYDSVQQTIQSQQGGGAGYSVGGAIQASKTFSDAFLSLSYHGEYRNIPNSVLGSGTNQSLNLLYTKQLGRRWSLSFAEAGGVVFYGGNGYVGSAANSGGGVPTNPFSPSTRFLQSRISATYRQTQRLSYIVSGNFFLSRYSYSGATGTTGVTFSGSAQYVLTARTTVGGTFSHDNYYFQHDAGDSVIDGGFANVKHLFGRGWNVNVSAGVTRAHSQGTIHLPIQVIIPGQGTVIIGYQVGDYNTVKYVPTVQGSLDHRIGRYDVRVSGGRGVNPGNGTYLTSTNTFFGGMISRMIGRTSTISGSTYISRLTSIANTVAQSYTQDYTTINYSRVLRAHMSANFSYSYNRYGSLLGYGPRVDNRYTAGISFSTKNIPFTFF